MGGFSFEAAARLQSIYERDHSKEIGTKAWEALTPNQKKTYAHYKKTDCVTFALEVLIGALEQAGEKDGLSGLNRTVAKHDAKGTKIAEYLVKSLGWVGVYVTPDLYRPAGNRDEHAEVYRHLSKTCRYYEIPISFLVTNYSPSAPTVPSLRFGDRQKEQTVKKLAPYMQLMSLEFGFGLSSGGDHTWLYSSGDVYEVHWSAWGKDGGLYERTALSLWSFVDNVIVIPPDSVGRLEISSAIMRRFSLEALDTCEPKHNPW